MCRDEDGMDGCEQLGVDPSKSVGEMANALRKDGARLVTLFD